MIGYPYLLAFEDMDLQNKIQVQIEGIMSTFCMEQGCNYTVCHKEKEVI